MRTQAVAGIAVAVGVGLAVWSGAGPAGAHGSGAIELIDASPSGPLEVRVEVCVAYADEHEAANPGEVTARAQGPGTAEVPPAAMETVGATGVHVATVTFPDPGSWTVVVESTNPPATLSVPVTVGTDERASPAVGSGGANAGAACAGESDGPPTWLVAGLGAVGAAVVFGGLLWLLRRGGTDPA